MSQRIYPNGPDAPYHVLASNGVWAVVATRAPDTPMSATVLANRLNELTRQLADAQRALRHALAANAELASQNERLTLELNVERAMDAFNVSEITQLPPAHAQDVARFGESAAVGTEQQPAKRAITVLK